MPTTVAVFVRTSRACRAAIVPSDTDGDGIANTWETDNGLNPNLAADGSTTTLSVAELGVAGYTNLEVYLDWLAHEREMGR